MTWLISDLVKLKRTSGLHASANELRHARLQAFRNTNAMAVHARDVGTGPAHAGDKSHLDRVEPCHEGDRNRCPVEAGYSHLPGRTEGWL
jgi:hypothetical protein